MGNAEIEKERDSEKAKYRDRETEIEQELFGHFVIQLQNKPSSFTTFNGTHRGHQD